MLLLSIYRMCRVAAIHIVILLFISFILLVSFASANERSKSKRNEKATVSQDLLISGEAQQDILTSPQNKKSSKKSSKSSSNNKQSTNKQSATTATNPVAMPAQSGKTSKPDKNIDVYIGRCSYTVESVKEAKKFIANHKDYYSQYFMMKTDSDYEVKPSDLADIEVYLPLDAEKYDVNHVPAFIINVNGHIYKVSGAIDLEEIYKEIVSGKAKGERKDGYTDLGVKGRTCRAIIVNLAPKKSLTEEEKRAVLRDAGRPPNFTALLHQRKIVLPENNSPSITEKKTGTVSPHGLPMYIVFSKEQKKWALEMSKKGAMGCCTDCIDIGDISHFAQLCTKELLAEFNVKSTPAIVTLKN